MGVGYTLELAIVYNVHATRQGNILRKLIIIIIAQSDNVTMLTTHTDVSIYLTILMAPFLPMWSLLRCNQRELLLTFALWLFHLNLNRRDKIM